MDVTLESWEAVTAAPAGCLGPRQGVSLITLFVAVAYTAVHGDLDGHNLYKEEIKNLN